MVKLFYCTNLVELDAKIHHTKSENNLFLISLSARCVLIGLLMCVREFSEQRFFAFISLCADWSHNDHQNLIYLYTV